MKKSQFKAIIIGALIISLPLFGFGKAFAQSVDQKLSQTQEEVTKLFDLKDNTDLSEEEKVQQEKELRIKIIGDIIEVSDTQLKNITDKLNKTKLPESEDWKNIKDNYLKSIDNFQKFYSEKKESLKSNADINIDNLKKIAKEIEDKKTSQIDPVTGKVSNILVTFSLSDILILGDQRLEKVRSDVAKIYSKKLTKNQSLQNLSNQAADLIESAHQANNKSKEIMLHLYSDDLSSSSTKEYLAELKKEIDKNKPTLGKGIETASSTLTESESNKELEDYISTLNNLSFDKVKSAYETFVKMSINVKQYLK